MDEAEKRREKNPRQDAGILSIITFAWLFKTFIRGFKRELNLSDLYYSLDEHSSHNLGEQISTEWKKEKEKCKNIKRTPSLLRVLFRCFGKEIALAGLVQALLEFTVRLSRPFILLQLLRCSHEKSDVTKDEIGAFSWAAALALGVLIDCFVSHLSVQNLIHIGMKIRVSCCSLLYRKILNVPLTFMDSQTSGGQVLNLLSNDVSRLDHAIYYVHYIWMGPLQAILIFYFLYQEIGLAACSGIVFQILFVPILGLFGRLTNHLTSKYTVKTDERLRLTNEIIKGIRSIKMYAWEKPFSNLVDQTRKKEMQIVKKHSIITDVSLASEFYIPRLCVFITILAYIFLGNGINAEKVYVVMAFYDILRYCMYTLFPMCLHDVAEALVSVKRIEKFMEIAELSDNALLLNDEKNEKQPDEEDRKNKSFEQMATVDDGAMIMIELRGVSAQWDARAKVLDCINMQINDKSLTAVVGRVGSGKSSLLHAILREIPGARGELRVRGTISYASQEPWIFTSSVKQNILFGLPLDAKRYEKVIDVCQLRQDLDTFPLGDETLLGEKGINLSGGQCARLNLARAIYRDADVYLLDDPLSAVDALVGARIFRECIRGHLRDKTVLLVTHQLHFLQDVDRIVVIDEGRIQVTAASLQELNDTCGVNLVSSLAKAVTQVDDDRVEHATDNGLPHLPSPPSPANRNSPVDNNSSTTNSVDRNNKVKSYKKYHAEKKSGDSGITLKTYAAYILASKNIPLVFLVMATSILHQLAASGGDYFMAYWVNTEENSTSLRHEYYSCNGSECTTAEAAAGHHERYIYFYAGITVSHIVLCLLQSWSFFEMSMKIANNLHANMFNSILSTTIDFFSTNPLGRIMNRFSKDISIVDTEVSRAMIDVIQNAIHMIAAFCVVISINPWLVIPAGFVALLFYIFSLFFIKTTRSIKRLEGITRSPVFSHVTDSLQGLTTIRALGARDTLVDEFDDHQNLHSSAWFIYFSGSRGLGMYLDLFCTFFLASVLVTILLFDRTTLIGNIGLAVTQCMLMLNTLQWGVRQFAELENQMTSVERVMEYSKLPAESETRYYRRRRRGGVVNDELKDQALQLDAVSDSMEPGETNSLTAVKVFSAAGDKNTVDGLVNWPSQGRIEFKNVSLRYEIAPTSASSLILKNLNFTIDPGEKIGIIGRTGAGKSTLINCLFQLGYVEGDILIDQVSTNSVPLKELRSKISMIPQEPILFTGSLRKNLDPFDEYTSEELWQALEDVGMKQSLGDTCASGLESVKVSEGGSNFSIGERQLLCLARAILRRNKILVLDEATANVDPYTDDVIQKTVKQKFHDCTILTIAHRLHTVMGSDRILVINSGVVIEFDHPFILLTEKKGFLNDIVSQSDPATAQIFTQNAKLNFEKKMENNEN